MNILSEIAKKIKGSHCERLVKQTGTEVAVTGASFGVGTFRIDVGDFSNKIKEFYKVPQVMIALDNTQYLLCGAISEMREKEFFKRDCIKIRLQLILAFSQLQALLCVARSTEELRKELTRWMKYMTQLNRESIELLKPSPKMIAKGVRSRLSQVMKYQGVDEGQMNEALSLLV